MATKYFSFDYSEMKGSLVLSLGMLTFSSEKSVNRQELIEHTRRVLEKPESNFIITTVSKITEKEFEKINHQQKN